MVAASTAATTAIATIAATAAAAAAAVTAAAVAAATAERKIKSHHCWPLLGHTYACKTCCILTCPNKAMQWLCKQYDRIS